MKRFLGKLENFNRTINNFFFIFSNITFYKFILIKIKNNNLLWIFFLTNLKHIKCFHNDGFKNEKNSSCTNPAITGTNIVANVKYIFVGVGAIYSNHFLYGSLIINKYKLN